MKTTQQYLSLDTAYEYFNEHLFTNELPICLITFQRKSKSRGYFHANQFSGKNGNSNQTTDEIALNPDHFGRTDQEVLSTLVHEMVHLWQQHFGKKSSSGYHNKQWGSKMEEIGLMPSATGDPEGKRTGQKVSHYVIEGGLFESCAEKLLIVHGEIITWKSTPEGIGKPKTQSKVKYTCAECGQNAWAKPGASLECGLCGVVLESQV